VRLALLLALLLVLGACAPGTAFPFDSGSDWPETGGGPPVVVTPPADDFPPITLDPIIPPIVLPLEPPPVDPPVTNDPPKVVDPPAADPPGVAPPAACRVRILPPTAAIERITKCPREPARLTRRR
jgi:hypothetical protein